MSGAKLSVPVLVLKGVYQLEQYVKDKIIGLLDEVEGEVFLRQIYWLLKLHLDRQSGKRTNS